MSMLLNSFWSAAAGGGGSDPAFSSVVILSGFEGADGSTTFTDESSYARTLTPGGNTQIDTAQFKFGTSSALFDGSGDTLQASDAAELEFGAGQFTVECWVRFNSLTAGLATMGLLSKSLSNSNPDWALRYVQSGTLIQFVYYDGAVLQTVGAGVSLSTGVWYHVAADRDASDVLRVYLDGVMIASATVSFSFANNAGTARIGFYSRAALTRVLNGWLDEVRWTVGTARYASDGGFTVPSAAFPRS